MAAHYNPPTLVALPDEILWHIAPCLTCREGTMMIIVAVATAPWRRIAQCPRVAALRSARWTDQCTGHYQQSQRYGQYHDHRTAHAIYQCGCCSQWVCDLCVTDNGGWCCGEGVWPCEHNRALCPGCSDSWGDNLGRCEECFDTTLTNEGVYIIPE